MERPLKFRAWNGSEFYYFDLAIGQEIFLDPTQIKDVQEFTGLIDDINSLVYGGDILELTENWGEGDSSLHVVYYRVCWWEVRPRYLMDLGRLWFKDDIRKKIVGNIYEHPHLIRES